MSAGFAIATGNFDGLHLGHCKILSALAAEAKALRLTPLVLSYEPHTRHFLVKPGDPPLLCTLDQKKQMIQNLGLQAEALPFDRNIAGLDGVAYVREVIIGRYGAKVWVFGPNHRFGVGGKGDLTQVQAQFPDLRIVRVDPLEMGGEPISSSRIRNLLAAGEVALAAELLGRPYALRGVVVHGEARGRTIGFPTANLQIPPYQMMPGFGVYAGWVNFEGESHKAVVNIGMRPTFQALSPTIEIHLPGWSGDLYGKTMEMKLNLKLRGELHFASIQDLKMQIACDVQRALSMI